MEECLFCKIIKGKVDSLKLYEDDDILVMLDAYPDSPGHTLIIPKKHYLDLSDIPIELLDKILLKAKDIKVLLENKLNPTSVVLIQNNGERQKIKHYHLHLIPYYNEKQYLSNKMPEIIESNNEEAIYRYLSDNEFKEYLKLKLSEELNEILSSKNNIETLEEIADLLEVIKFYLKVHNYTLEDALNMCEIKNEKKGTFNNKILLIKTK